MSRRAKSPKALKVEQVSRLLGQRMRAKRHRHEFTQKVLADIALAIELWVPVCELFKR